MESTLDRVCIDRGATIPFDELPDRHVALDGYVQGPAIDAARRRYSFDHHAGCIRHATLSTCEMTLDALRVGLDPSDLTICINDLDCDTVLAVWLLLRPAASASRRAARAICAAGRRDALGPAVPDGLFPSLRWALAPMRTRAGELRELSVQEWREILSACLNRLDGWLAAGAPRRSAQMRPPREVPSRFRMLFDLKGWCMVESSGGAAFDALYASGVRAGIVARPLGDGTWEYTVGKASEFVDGFDVPAILAALRVAEATVAPGQAQARSWGGGTTIGGSPRNVDGSASRLQPEDVAAVVEALLRAR